MNISEIKRYFFAHRNGITADVLRKAGSPFLTIFGVEVPAISRLARKIGTDAGLGWKLWEDSEVRESRMLAPWLFDPETLMIDEIMQLASSVRCSEDANMLAFRILKRRHDRKQLLARLKKEASNRLSVHLSYEALQRHLE